MDLTWILIVWTILSLIYSIVILRKARKLQKPASPFRTIPMTAKLECPKCGKKISREWKANEYVMGKYEKCPKCKRRKMIMQAVYCEKKKTPKQIAEEKIIEEKWK